MEELKVVELTTQRKGEISLALLLRKMKKERFSLTRTDVLKTVGRVLQKIESRGVTKDELLMLYQWIVGQAIKDSFGVEVTENEPKIGRKRAEEISLMIYEDVNIIKEIPLNQDELKEKIIALSQELLSVSVFSADELFSLFREKVYSDIKKIFN